MHTLSEENHIKAIYKLRQNESGRASTNSLSTELGMKASSVTDMLRKLSEKELVLYEKYKGAKLSESGERLALLIVRKHRLWETFLVNKLNFGWDEVHDIAEQLEHIKSKELISRLDSYLGFPKIDPHGDPIPDELGNISSLDLSPLDSLEVGQYGAIGNITHHDRDFLHYLEQNKLLLGVSIAVEDRLDFDGSMGLLISDKTRVRVSKEVAEKILIHVSTYRISDSSLKLK
jgi:DtxR family Mn-dependent transcriptional regulator